VWEVIIKDERDRGMCGNVNVREGTVDIRDQENLCGFNFYDSPQPEIELPVNLGDGGHGEHVDNQSVAGQWVGFEDDTQIVKFAIDWGLETASHDGWMGWGGVGWGGVVWCGMVWCGMGW
jgi:hypothetical protein